jgi:hypothetical protein
VWYLTFGGGTPQTGLTKQLFFDAGPTLEESTGLGLFGRIIAAGEGDGPGSVNLSPVAAEGPVSTTHAAGPAQTQLFLIGSVPQDAIPQGTRVAGFFSSIRSAPSDLSSPVTAQPTAPTLVSAEEQILRADNSQTISDALDGVFVALASKRDDVTWKFGL